MADRKSYQRKPRATKTPSTAQIRAIRDLVAQIQSGPQTAPQVQAQREKKPPKIQLKRKRPTPAAAAAEESSSDSYSSESESE